MFAVPIFTMIPVSIGIQNDKGKRKKKRKEKTGLLLYFPKQKQ
jgi:hypothetical protein